MLSACLFFHNINLYQNETVPSYIRKLRLKFGYLDWRRICLEIDMTLDISSTLFKLFFRLFLIGFLVSSLSNIKAEVTAFDSCPSKAYLIQGQPATLFGVNLVTGSYNTLSSNLGTNGKINAIGFSLHDQFMYAWGQEDRSVIKIGKDFNFEVIDMDLTLLPSEHRELIENTNFYIGDVSASEKYYYFNRNGSGLYKLDIDPESNSFKKVTLVTDYLNLRIYDLAFHPYNGFAYSLSSTGNLYKINSTDGTYEYLGYAGVTGIFGAVYFDADENFYASNNQSGKVYRMNVDTEINELNVVEFAQGPMSSSNDGSRCAIAPVIDQDEEDAALIDWGDAPNLYGTDLNSNGARHEILATGPYLGASVNGENNSLIADTSDDGVDFVTDILTTQNNIINVVASDNSYLDAWIDYDQNGSFDSNEKIFEAQALIQGDNYLSYNTPVDAILGSTWARFRVSDTGGLGPTGGFANGEVEDYQVEIKDGTETSVSYPSENSFVYLAYEDFWPIKGDFDFNDVVIKYRTTVFKTLNQVTKYKIEGSLVASGAGYSNAFAVRLRNINRENIDINNIEFSINGLNQQGSPLDDNAAEAIVTIFSNIKNLYTKTSGCNFFQTELKCKTEEEIPFSVTIPLITAIDSSIAANGVLDPFIFAADNVYHNNYVTLRTTRTWEVHLKNQSPTELFDYSLFGLGDDRTSSENYFITSNGHAWAIQINGDWLHPVERVNILEAYPKLQGFLESEGQINSDWSEHPNYNKVYNINE
jgi:LruC domain-containing protein